MKKLFLFLIFVVFMLSSCSSKSTLTEQSLGARINMDKETQKLLCVYEDEQSNNNVVEPNSELFIASPDNDKSFDGSIAKCTSENAMAFEGRCCIPNFGDLNQLKDYMGIVLNGDKSENSNIFNNIEGFHTGFQMGNYLIVSGHSITGNSKDYVFYRADGKEIEFTSEDQIFFSGINFHHDDLKNDIENGVHFPELQRYDYAIFMLNNNDAPFFELAREIDIDEIGETEILYQYFNRDLKNQIMVGLNPEKENIKEKLAIKSPEELGVDILLYDYLWNGYLYLKSDDVLFSGNSGSIFICDNKLCGLVSANVVVEEENSQFIWVFAFDNIYKNNKDVYLSIQGLKEWEIDENTDRPKIIFTPRPNN